MNAENGRMRITEGIWLARCIRPCMLVMDVEGYDGRERAEDNRAFERQIALLALTISDLMMVNMWLHDIGRVEGGSVPLLRTLFQERAKLGPGRTKVLVVIRGYDYKTPFEILEKDVVRSMEQLWESIHYQSGQQIVQFSAYIEVLVVALPDAVLQETRFEEESDLAGYRQDKVSARGFSFSVKKIWQTIRNNRRLDIPTHRMMVSIVFCERSAEDSLNLLESHEDYLSLKSDTEITPMEFSKKLENLMDCILFRYDQETLLYEAHVRNLKRQVLEADILNKMRPICWGLLQKLYSAASTESRAEITYQLSNAADPAMLVDELVEERLQMFVESCEGLSVIYQDLCDKTCEMLREVLTTFARAQSMKDLRIIKKDVKESDEDQRRDAMHRFQNLREEFEQENEARAQDSRGYMYILSAVAPVLLPALIAIISAVIRRRTR
ncbi:protein ROOT HAIR DEFECTIVE 3 homolog 1-like [Typha angustifolia]|uniref:protein ROOT HAIR DEFECTIVE 3 homolog 1-like n=1 Tax=Typha angustifolia TaxID=59011 RepID=UPI003C2D8947